jgi:N-glycosylase/DNA lyase
MNAIELTNGVLLSGIEDFDLAQTLDCGQCFRWEQIAPQSYMGVVKGKVATIHRLTNDIDCEDESKYNYLIEGATRRDFDEIWREYFDFDRDYSAIKSSFCCDIHLSKATFFAPGIRILKQDTWEALCSFIISQNNNIPRIKGIIKRLCESFGDEISENIYSFPSPQTLASLETEDLAPLRAGFRAGYILDAARKVASGMVDLDALRTIDIDTARKTLCTIKGVGVKVAECTLLFGCGRLEAFPIDVWIKRVLDALYPNGFPKGFANYAGIAQQYLFHYARCVPSILDTNLR